MRAAAPSQRRGAPPTPAGYVEVRSPAGGWWARPECAEAIQAGAADVLLRGQAVRSRRAGRGRGDVIAFDLAGISVVGKRAQHGGLFGRLLGGAYLGNARALAQLRLADELERRGIPTPEVMAVGWRRLLGPFLALAIVTRAIAAAQNLYEAARDEAPWRRRRILLEHSADLIRVMHDVGFLHADLNVTNLVLGRGPAGDRMHVVDLDRGRLRGNPLSERERMAGLARLLRSYEKWIAGRWRLGHRQELVFLHRYCGADRDRVRRFQRRLQRSRWRFAPRRMLWWLLRGSAW
jgi:Lipopolysaccharide kinase (Kdo/WaaP) family